MGGECQHCSEGRGGLCRRLPLPPSSQAMVFPWTSFRVSGVIFYQGEASTQTLPAAQRYEVQLRLLITSYRKAWASTVPFFVVQLPGFSESRVAKSCRRCLKEASQKKVSKGCTAFIKNQDKLCVPTPGGFSKWAVVREAQSSVGSMRQV